MNIVYRVEFSGSSRNYPDGDIRQVLSTLAQLEQYTNDKLRKRGHIFLNEVLDILDLLRVREGQTVGWVWKKFNFDSAVRFNPAVSEQEKISLEFNPYGDIMDEVWKV